MKKTIYIVLGALLIFGLLFLLWSWFFSASTDNSQNGSFGEASSTQNTGANGGTSGNGVTQLGGTSGNSTANGTIPLDGSQSGTQVNGTQGVGLGTTGTGSATTTFGNSTAGVDGVMWLNASSGGNAFNGAGFNPTEINGVGGQGIDGSIPNISGGAAGTSGNGLSLIETLGITGLAGGISCAIQAGIAALSTGSATIAGIPAGLAVGSTLVAPSPNPLTNPLTSPGLNIVADYGVRINTAAIYELQLTETQRNAGKDQLSFLQCITNTIAKVALAQITASVVNWINSGFNGQPSFVTNYEQFFTNVADVAAGQFIKDSGNFAFLCSPFKLKIQIAIAQAYAKRNAQSCSLTQVIKNVNGFMNGAFSAGGWAGFVSFTTIPTNNPYGAFAYAQVGLASAQAQAQQNAKNNISPTGFLNLQKLTGCYDPAQNGIAGGYALGTNPQAAIAGGRAALPPGCKAQVITPGSAISDSLGFVNKSGVDQLGIGNSIDQIISALTTQLITRMLQNGLTSLSNTSTGGQTPQQAQAQAQAQTILTDLQTRVTLAQQYGSIQQGAIHDIQNAQQNLSALQNCWLVQANSASLADDKKQQAAANADLASSTLQSLNTRVDVYNNNITVVNAKIASIEELETQALTVASVSDVAALQSAYNSLIASGQLVTQADITTAQQDRTTLQSEMNSQNNSTQSGMNQCQNFK